MQISNTKEKKQEITQDFFLRNKISMIQPKIGYRAGIDAVLLGAAGFHSKGENIAELGCGVGVALFSLLKRKEEAQQPYKRALGLEIDEKTFELTKQNAQNNGIKNLELDNLNGLIPNNQYENQFDLVISNPPFFDDEKSIRGPDASRHKAYVIGAPLINWVKAMLRLCRAKGEILIIHRADRMFDILEALKGRAGDVRILPIHPKTSQNANRILIRARKYSKAPTQILGGLYLRDINDPDKYLSEIDDMCNGVNIDAFKGLFE